MSPRTGVLIFEGGQGLGGSARGVGGAMPAGAVPGGAVPGDLLARVRDWTTLDTAEKFKGRPGVDLVVVATDRPALARQATSLGAIVHPTASPFHFGRILAGLVSEHRLDRVVYLGGGSAPLLGLDEVDLLLGAIAGGGRVFAANNAQSPDIVGLGTTEAVPGLAGLETDNATLFALTDAGYERILLPETATAGFDLDTPSDVIFLAYEAARRTARAANRRPGALGQLGPRLAAGLPSLGLDTSTLERAARVLARGDYPSVSLVGRVSGPIVSYLNRNLFVRLRVFSEERGMKALGRIEGGQVRSLLADMARDLGVDRLVGRLAELSEAVFWDTRVLMAALGSWPDEADRFWADLGEPDKVKDRALATLCRAALSQPSCPFVLGGHSVVAGGLRLLVDGLLPVARSAVGPGRNLR